MLIVRGSGLFKFREGFGLEDAGDARVGDLHDDCRDRDDEQYKPWRFMPFTTDASKSVNNRTHGVKCVTLRAICEGLPP